MNNVGKTVAQIEVMELKELSAKEIADKISSGEIEVELKPFATIRLSEFEFPVFSDEDIKSATEYLTSIDYPFEVVR